MNHCDSHEFSLVHFGWDWMMYFRKAHEIILRPEFFRGSLVSCSSPPNLVRRSEVRGQGLSPALFRLRIQEALNVPCVVPPPKRPFPFEGLIQFRRCLKAVVAIIRTILDDLGNPRPDSISTVLAGQHPSSTFWISERKVEPAEQAAVLHRRCRKHHLDAIHRLTTCGQVHWLRHSAPTGGGDPNAVFSRLTVNLGRPINRYVSFE